MDKIEIKVLGTFDVLVNGKSIVSCFAKSQKGSVLMRYLLLHRDRAVSHNDLYDVLWPDEDRRNPESALKTLVSRLRDALNRCHKGLDESILSGRGTFQWNGDYPITLDLADFERLCAALTNVQALTPQTREMFESVLSLYKGDLYAKEAQDMWVISSSVYLRNLYEETVYRYLELLKADKDYDEIVLASRKALEINAYSEKLHIALMEALVKTKRHNEALTHYKHAKNIHLRYLGVQPPKNILDFYTSIIQSGQVLDLDIDRIRDELRAYDTGKGAFVCEYSVFKEIYNLELRSFERTKRVLFLALIMLKSTNGKPMEPLKLDDLMKDLLDVLTSHLRKGDTVTHYSASQYALLLPLQSEDEGEKVMERIKASFYRKHRNASVILHYRLGLVADAGAGKA